MWSAAEADAFVMSLCLPSLARLAPSLRVSAGKDTCESKPKSISDASMGIPKPALEPQEGRGSPRSRATTRVALPLFPSVVTTPKDQNEWTNGVQSFPTEGRSQLHMASCQLGTTSQAGTVQRYKTRQGGVRKVAPLAQRDEVPHGSILVVTEVRREIAQDPDFQPMAEGEGVYGGHVPSLDELPAPLDLGRLGTPAD